MGEGKKIIQVRRESTIRLGEQEFGLTGEWGLLKAIAREKDEKSSGGQHLKDFECHAPQSGLHF